MSSKGVTLGIFFLIVGINVIPYTNANINNIYSQEYSNVAPPREEWNQSFGGFRYDWGYSVVQTTDEGYALAGLTGSYGQSKGGHRDIWLIKTDDTGIELWNKTYGGEADDVCWSIKQTNDGGLILTGVYLQGLGVIKTKENGDVEWSKVFGNKMRGWCIELTSDGGYIIVGSIGTFNRDVLLLKIDENGNEQWTRRFEGFLEDVGYSVKSPGDAGYIIVGETYELHNTQDSDVLLIKTDENGNKQWARIIGKAESRDIGSDVVNTDDGYIITGDTDSYGDGVWVIKTDENGNELWNKTFGIYGRGRSILRSLDGHVVIAGFAVLNNRGYGSCLIKIDNDGNEIWSQTYCSNDAYSVQQTTDGGFILGGVTFVEGNWADALLVKVTAEGVNTPPESPFISGPTWGKICKVYEYNFSLSDPEDDSMYLRIDWGSGIPGPLHGPFASGTKVKLNHTWNQKGTYTIKAKAEDIYGAESDWGELTVTMPRNKATYNSLFIKFLEQFPIIQKILNFLTI